MKKIIILSFLLLSVGFANAQDKVNPLQKYADTEGLTSVVVTKKMLAFIPIDSFVKYEGIDFGEFLDKVNFINIYTTTDKIAANKLLSFANNLMKTSSYEKMMEVKSDKVEKVDFFIKNKGTQISELIFIVKAEGDKSVVMQFMGDFTLEDIKKMVQQNQKKVS